MGKVLVTGGTGYIGSHTVVELMQTGLEPVIVDNLSNSLMEVLDGICEITGKQPLFYEVDLKDVTKLKRIFQENQFESVIHFAAYKAVGESVEKPLLYYENNLVSLINLLKLMSEFRVNSLVFSSSCTVYGQPEELPVTENAPVVKAMSPYGNTKQIAEEIITDAVQAKMIEQAVLLRYFNPIGAHPSAKIGELPLNVPNNLVPFITQTAIGLREELKIFGDDYNTPDGSCIRDYINVVDLAKAHIAAVKRMKESAIPVEVFNVGTGNGVSVFEVVNAFQRVSGQDLNYSIVGRRSGDVEKVYADTNKANELLGWKAEKSLDETILSAWEWEKYIRLKDQNY
ncbi:MAG: UDP-glucose 4-epimerase GalE [Marinilabiliales bacterium]|nr:MAG: UDP-glucose 4-epimerase GalE [Marinilabiliales bacterium]